eukprot:scaffold1271_cov167-Amphora_coffeaeformis.AAC.6
MKVSFPNCAFVSASLLLIGSNTVSAGTPVIDNTGALKLGNLPEPSLDFGTYVLISSPGTASPLLEEEASAPLSTSADCLVCRGATLSGTTEAERLSLGTSSLLAGAIIVDGVTIGDLQAGLADSRHGRTLTALFRARMQLMEGPPSKQTLIIAVHGSEDSFDKDAIVEDVHLLFEAVAAEKEGTPSFEDAYEIFVTSAEDKSKVLSLASEASKGALSDSSLTESYNKVKSSNFAALGLDTPSTAKAFVDVGNAFGYYTRVARAKVAAWKSRVARGLLIDDFGASATELRQIVLQGFDSDTLAAAGLPLVADYRVNMRASLQAFVETGITDIFSSLLQNLEKKILKRFNAALLKTMNDPAESLMNSNAATVRRETFAFEKSVEAYAVPSLGLNKDKAIRDLQGFCGYQLGGNSLTFGIHNDADDPQVIAQFGGVRPPLLRVQPKLRVDVEM